MRIDYSEPKKSYISDTNPVRKRKESNGIPVFIMLILVVLFFVVGFGTGWFFSQKATKRSFQAATQQTSLENSVKSVNAPQAIAPSPPSVAPSSTVPQTATTISSSSAAQGTVAQPETDFSFYKNLPAGQKSSVIGSGVNAKEGNSKAKQSLQAVIPLNVVQPHSSPASQSSSKPVVTHSPDKLPEVSGYTVQVASFPLKSEAELSKNKLNAKGYNAFVLESNQGDKGIWYRVQIGKKMDQNTAKELAAKIGKGALAIAERP